jgi:hypothetical protein
LVSRSSNDDFVERLESLKTREPMYVFKPTIAGVAVYLKVVVRHSCVVISFHADEVDDEES